MKKEEIHNLFAYLPERLEEELFEELLRNEHFYLERIISQGQITEPGTWLCEEMHEWVMLLTGSAKLQYKIGLEEISLKPGDYLNIPARTLHRVSWTDPEEKTVWLALYYD